MSRNEVKTPDDLSSSEAIDLDDPTYKRARLLEIPGEPIRDAEGGEVIERLDNVLYRTVEEHVAPGLGQGMLICRAHVVECRDLRFHGERLRVVAVGPRERAWLAFLGDAKCQMCLTHVAFGNLCGSCETPLHPQWPAVYCSNACALEDR